MIRFFRKIRQKLLIENRFTRYLLYAIGEIVLVMVGILLALGVNKWNQSQERSELEYKMLRELRTNLRADSLDHAENIRWYERAVQSALIINNALENRVPWHDSMSTHFGNIYTHGISTLNVSAYESLKTIGLDLISNDSIRIALTNLHSISYELMRKSEEGMVWDNNNQMVLPVFTTRLKMDKWFHAVPHDYEALMDDVVFQETLRFRGITLDYVGNNTHSANNRVSKLIRMIDRELKVRSAD
jgi:hypothetical protein